MNWNLLKNTDIRLASTTAKGVTNPTTAYSQIVDMLGAEGCMFILTRSSEGASAASTMVAQGSSVNSTAAMVTYQEKLAITASTQNIWDARVHLFDVHKPDKRYLRVKVAGNSTGDLKFLALRYGLRKPGSTSLHGSSSVGGSTIIIPTTA